MTTRTCWHCGAYAQMQRTQTSGTPFWLTTNASGQYDLFCSYKCASCGWGSIGLVPDVDGPPSATHTAAEEANSIKWYPLKAVGKAFPDVPTEIASAATEATECLSMQHNRAAVILARAVVEAVAKDKGIASGQISKKIDELCAQGLIRSHTKDAAHEIRFLANSMAHGDFALAIGSNEAEDVLNFMEEVLDEVYQGPARVDRQRAARLARSVAGSHGTPPATP